MSNSKNSESTDPRTVFHPKYVEDAAGGKLLYIAGEDGETYAISEERLKKEHKIDKDDPNVPMLSELATAGVPMAAKKTIDVQDPPVIDGKLTRYGFFVGFCLGSVHFLNLKYRDGSGERGRFILSSPAATESEVGEQEAQKQPEQETKD